MPEAVSDTFNAAANPAPQAAVPRAPYTVKELNEAIRKKDAEAVREILATKEVADLNANDEHSWSPVRLAISESSVECLWQLLAAGANANLKSHEYHQETPLSYAVQHYYASVAIVKVLLQYGADPNIQPREDEKLPILQAAKHGKETILKLLLNAGADVEGADHNGQTAVHYAAQAGYAGIIRILGAHGAELDKPAGSYEYTPLVNAVTHHHREAFEALLDCGASPFTKPEDGNTSLMQAAWAGETAAVEILAKRGVDIDAQNKDRQTALIWAAYGGRQYVAEKLLELGANPLLRDKDGKSAANIALQEGHDDVAALIEAKAALYMPSDKGISPLKPFRIVLGVKNGQ